MSSLNKNDIAIVAIALMLASDFISELAGYPMIYHILVMGIYLVMYLIAVKIEEIWTPAVIYSLCISPVAWVLAGNQYLSRVMSGNNYVAMTQAMLAICFSLLLYYVICYSPSSTQMFLLTIIAGILFTRNYTCLYCLYLLVYLFAPLGFKIRRIIGKYMRLIRLFTLPFILISLPLILYTNTLASCPAFMLLLLAYYQVIYKSKLKVKEYKYDKDRI